MAVAKANKILATLTNNRIRGERNVAFFRHTLTRTRSFPGVSFPLTIRAFVIKNDEAAVVVGASEAQRHVDRQAAQFCYFSLKRDIHNPTVAAIATKLRDTIVDQ